MEITPKQIFTGLVALAVLGGKLIWLSFFVWHIFNIANVVSGNAN